MHAVLQGSSSILKYLLIDHCCNVHAIDDDGKTSLMLGAICGVSYKIETLLMMGANLDDQDNVRNHIQMNFDRLFIETFNFKPQDGRTALMHAVINGKSAVMDILLKYRASRDIKDRVKITFILQNSVGYLLNNQC